MLCCTLATLRHLPFASPLLPRPAPCIQDATGQVPQTVTIQEQPATFDLGGIPTLGERWLWGPGCVVPSLGLLRLLYPFVFVLPPHLTAQK